MPCDKLNLSIEILEDDQFDIDADYIILRQEDWNVIEYWLKICKKSGLLEEDFSNIKEVITWPLNMRRHA